jgi:hypothetical protein
MNPPWWFCNGWWSPWCLLDVTTRCKFEWICDKHDAAIMGDD